MGVSGRHRRIMIGAGCFADAEAAMRLAERILANLPAELGGVLVEESAVPETVRFPGQRVVTAGGSLKVPPSPRQIRAVAESDARAFRDRLARMAQTRSAELYFERRDGDLIRGVFEAAKGWDILLLGYREMHKCPGQVVVVTDASGAPRACTLAGDLAQALKTGIVMLSLAGDDADMDQTGATRIALNSVSELLAQLSRINASAVVVDLVASPLEADGHLRQLLEAARCPVVVLGAGQGAGRGDHAVGAPGAGDRTAERGTE